MARILYDEYGSPELSAPYGPGGVEPRLRRPEDELPPMPSFDAPPPRRRSITDQLIEMERTRPTLPRPNAWQRIAAGAVGGLAGLVNSGGRVQVDPSSAIAGIKYGDYPQREHEWDAKRKGMERMAKIEMDEIDDQRRAALYEKQAGAADATARAADARRQAAGQPKPFSQDKYDRAIQAGYSPKEAMLIAEGHGLPSTPKEAPARETPDQAFARREKEAAQLGLKPGTREYQSYVGTGRIPAPPKVPAPPKEPRATPGQSAAIEARKQSELRRAEREARMRLSKADESGETPDQVYADLETEKQRIQQAYEAEIQALGGSVTAPKSDAPPANLLKEGVKTTFANGQAWTLRNGKPTRWVAGR